MHCFALERPPMKLENHEAVQMRRSKMERYIDILNVLAHTGPLKLTHIMYKSNFNSSILKEYLNFLIKQGLVEERIIKKNLRVFAVTQRGITVLNHFQELTQEISAIEET
jgi:predicted transcriptional regulator